MDADLRRAATRPREEELIGPGVAIKEARRRLAEGLCPWCGGEPGGDPGGKSDDSRPSNLALCCCGRCWKPRDENGSFAARRCADCPHLSAT